MSVMSVSLIHQGQRRTTTTLTPRNLVGGRRLRTGSRNSFFQPGLPYAFCRCLPVPFYVCMPATPQWLSSSHTHTVGVNWAMRWAWQVVNGSIVAAASRKVFENQHSHSNPNSCHPSLIREEEASWCSRALLPKRRGGFDLPTTTSSTINIDISPPFCSTHTHHLCSGQVYQNRQTP